MKRIAIVLCLLVSGCSAIFMDTLPDDYVVGGRHAPHCTASEGWVGFDGLLATISAVAAGIEIARKENLLAAVDIIGAVVHAASAAGGSANAKRCRRAQDAWDDRLDRIERRGRREDGPGGEQ